jgi:hypothetical protein
VVIFGDECILERPIEEWPRCDVLISFFSQDEEKTFPIAKVPHALLQLIRCMGVHTNRRSGGDESEGMTRGGRVWRTLAGVQAQAYLVLRQSDIKYVINDLQQQYSLLDRRQVRERGREG